VRRLLKDVASDRVHRQSRRPEHQTHVVLDQIVVRRLEWLDPDFKQA
jgi:hypothetical protein